jgi:serine O-acetyltransferase
MKLLSTPIVEDRFAPPEPRIHPTRLTPSFEERTRSPGPTSAGARGPLAGLRRFREAVSLLPEAVRADHAIVHRNGVKYGGRPDRPEAYSSALVQKVGLQMMAAYRIMRVFAAARVPLAPKVLSRFIRHAYGSDIHWDAELAPGVMIVHGMGMAVSHAARVGPGVVLSQNVTLGLGTHPETRESGGPTIEENVVLGPGVTVLGPITVGARSKVMPGCLVVRSVPPDSLVEAVMPAVKPRSAARRAP